MDLYTVLKSLEVNAEEVEEEQDEEEQEDCKRYPFSYRRYPSFACHFFCSDHPPPFD